MSIFHHPDWVQDVTRVYLAIFYSVVALFYTLRILILKRATQREHVYHGQRFSPNWWHHKVFGVFRVAIWFLCVARWLTPSVDDYLGLLMGLSAPLVLMLGNCLLTGGFVWVILTHFALGRQWTSGIDQKGPTKLVTQGVYRYSRNPIFLGVLVSQFGFVLALPSWFSLLCLGVGVTTIVRQVREEERYLAQRFPIDYPLYQAQVPRWW